MGSAADISSVAERKPLARMTYERQANAWSEQIKTHEELIVTNHMKAEQPQVVDLTEI